MMLILLLLLLSISWHSSNDRCYYCYYCLRHQYRSVIADYLLVPLWVLEMATKEKFSNINNIIDCNYETKPLT